MSAEINYTSLGSTGESHFLGGVNNELNCFLFNALRPGEPTSAETVFGTVMVEANGGEQNPYFPYKLAGRAKKMPKGLIEVSLDEDTGETLLMITEEGHLAHALGGMVLPNTLGTNLPTQKLVGESNSRHVNGESVETCTAIDARLVIFGALYGLTSQNGWLVTGDLNSVGKEAGFRPTAIASQLTSLTTTPLVEKKPVIKNGKVKEYKYRIGQGPRHVSPGDVVPMVMIEGYLEAITKFMSRDKVAMQRGIDFVQETMQNKENMPYYVRRSIARNSEAAKKGHVKNGTSKSPTPPQIKQKYQAATRARVTTG